MFILLFRYVHACGALLPLQSSPLTTLYASKKILFLFVFSFSIHSNVLVLLVDNFVVVFFFYLLTFHFI